MGIFYAFFEGEKEMNEKLMAIQMKKAGLGNSLIAERLGINIATIRKYVEGITQIPKQDTDVDHCLTCGKKLVKNNGIQHFCSRTCRYEWWKNNMLLSPSKAVRVFKCECCGKTYVTYGNSQRKYCCHSCYIKDRFGNEKRTI